MSKCNLTVIVPVFNGEKYLKSCLKSIAAQTLDKIEVIVIDDGSTDNSADIAHSFEETNSHFTVLRQQNSGRSAARNSGLNIVKGEYIAFVDSDDFVDPTMYEKLYKTAVERQSNEVRCGAVQFEDKSGRIIKHRREFEAFTEINSTENLLKAYLEKKVHRVVWNGIYHRSLFEKIRFPEGKEYEDQYVTPEILAQANKYIYIPDSYYYYRKHPEAFSNSESFLPDALADKVQSLNKLYQLIDQFSLRKELSYQYSRYFYYIILGYHNNVILSKPWYLSKSRGSIDNLIIPEAFDYVMEQNHFEQKELYFIRLMRISHFLLFPVQKFCRMWDIISRVNTTSNKPNQKEIIDSNRDNSSYKKLIEIYL